MTYTKITLKFIIKKLNKKQEKDENTDLLLKTEKPLQMGEKRNIN